MRREPDFFGDVDLPLVYVAKKLKEALRIEEVFTEAGLDYLVEPDKYSGGVIFRSERVARSSTSLRPRRPRHGRRWNARVSRRTIE